MGGFGYNLGLSLSQQRTGGGGAFSPLSLFSGGEQGVWYDPSDLSTVWQDSARTVPGAVNSVVGCIDDKSGRGFNATQASTSLKPILRQSGALYYLEFDGFDDFMVSAAIDFTATDKMSVFTGLQSGTATSIQFLYELSATSDSNNGSFCSYTNGTAHEHNLRGTATSRLRTDTALSASTKRIMSVAYDIAGAAVADEINMRVNGVAELGSVAAAGPAGTGNFGNYALYIGRRGGSSLPFNGHIYGLIVRGKLSTSPEITATETYLAAKTGVTL